MKFYIYRDTKGEWRWHLKARNNKIIADSAESYKEKRKGMDMIRQIQPAPVIVELD